MLRSSFKQSPLPLKQGLAALVIALLLVACTEQDTVPLDLDGTVPLVEAPVHADTGNAEAKAEGTRLAEQMCFDDETLAQGIVQIANPDTGVVVSEIIVECDEVR